MNESFADTPSPNRRRGLREWWLSPPRSGIHRVIAPWVYRRLRFFGTMRVAAGTVLAAISVVCLAYGVYGWAAFFVVLAALNLAGGGWFLSIARLARPD